uniref:Transcriptional regulator, TetR family n=1 Tax=Hydrogenovibrio crunogenus (strain DSM 25203 / XCL-2) TaxID=317025 RepID=Q31G27_HYDCU
MASLVGLSGIKDICLKNTYENIINAAVCVWNEDYSAPLKSIAKEAGISRMTLHRHFCGRDAILLAIVEDFIEKIVLVLNQAEKDQDEPVQQMECLVKNTHRLIEDYNFLFDLFEQKGRPEDLVERFKRFEDLFEAFFVTIQAKGVIKPTIDFRWANALFEGVMKSGFRMKQKGFDQDVDLAAMIWDAYQSAIFTPEAIDEYNARV